MESQRLRVLWVTNLAPPYRLPLWEALARRVALRVALLEPQARLERDTSANRGPDWRPTSVAGTPLTEYRTWRIRRGEDRHYTLASWEPFTDVQRCDAVLLGGWDSPAYAQLLIAAKAARKPTLGFYESTLASQSFARGPIAHARAAFFRSLDAVVVPGPAAREAVLAMGVAQRRVHTGFNAVDSEAFAASPAVPSAAGHRFLYVGQLIERKNVEAILRAFAGIAQPDDRLTLVGQGPLRAALGALAHRLGVADVVDFQDYVPNKDLPALMARHDTLVLASHREVWGLVVNEALASGMQAVVTRNCGVAASVAGMPGVRLASPDASDLPETLRAARNLFVARIADPPILRHTPDRFAEVFATAFHTAASKREDRPPLAHIVKSGWFCD